MLLWHDYFDWAIGVDKYKIAELTRIADDTWQVDIRFARQNKFTRYYVETFEEAKCLCED